MIKEEFEKLKSEHEKRIKELESSENFLHYDFQGWPVVKRTLRELLEELGGKEENGMIGFKTSDDILDIYPQTISDDGMGYGVDETYISDSDISVDEKGKKTIRFWRDVKWKETEILEN